jgi:hypothetical protein
MTASPSMIPGMPHAEINNVLCGRASRTLIRSGSDAARIPIKLAATPVRQAASSEENAPASPEILLDSTTAVTRNTPLNKPHAVDRRCVCQSVPIIRSSQSVLTIRQPEREEGIQLAQPEAVEQLPGTQHPNRHQKCSETRTLSVQKFRQNQPAEQNRP